MNPVWLLDVDGVINCTRPGWHEQPSHGYATGGGHTYRMRWAPSLIGRICAAYRTGHVDIMWCSTWCPWADSIEGLFRTPRLGRAFHDQVNGWAAAQRKRDAARSVVQAGAPLIWTDDTVTPEVGDLYEELSRGASLLIRPDSRVGLTPEDMNRVDRFIDNMQANGVWYTNH